MKKIAIESALKARMADVYLFADTLNADRRIAVMLVYISQTSEQLRIDQLVRTLLFQPRKKIVKS